MYVVVTGGVPVTVPDGCTEPTSGLIVELVGGTLKKPNWKFAVDHERVVAVPDEIVSGSA